MISASFRYEIVIVNDGSTDGTTNLLKEFEENNIENMPVRIITHGKNKGYGASLKTGIVRARYQNICITDADSTYPNERIIDLFSEYEKGFDMVVGQRQFKKLPSITKPAKWMITTLANFMVGERIQDLNSGLRIFNKDIAIKFFPIICDGFSFTTTITLAMLSNNLSIEYMPIDYLKRDGKSKIKPIRDTLNFIQLIIRTVMYFNPLKIFIPLSLLLFSASLVLFILPHIGLLAVSHGNTITVLFVGGIQVLVTGMIADLIDKRVDK